MNIAAHLTLLNNSKTDIKNAIIAKGVTIDGSVPFANYAAKIASISSGGVTPFVRPVDWLTLPTVLNTEQKVVGLYAVFNIDLNCVAVNCAGAYKVDWGDGTVENFATGVQANHTYSYANISSDSLCSLGYKQVIITITPQTANNLTTVNLDVKNPQSGASRSSSGWLDIVVSSTFLTTLGVANNSSVYQSNLRQFSLISTNLVTAWNSMFSNCYSLQSIPLLDTSKGTSFAFSFSTCPSLQTIPTINTSNGTNFNYMFNSCINLKTMPLLDTSKGTDFSFMFSGCSSLQTIPALNTSLGTTFASMFNGCASLQTISAIDTSKGTAFNSMFYNCYVLQNIPALNASLGTTFSSMFYGCSSLLTIPTLDTSKGTTLSSMFYNCYSLLGIPALNVSAITSSASLSGMFATCTALATGVLVGTKYTLSYANCRLSATSLANIFTNLATVTGQTITITGCYGAAALTTDQRAIATAKGWTITG